MKTHYIVTGRIPFDDEDSLYVVEAETIDDAHAEFRRLILADRLALGIPDDELEEEDGEPSIYVNYYVRCEPGKKPEIEA